MNKKEFIYLLACTLGGGMVGFFANKLNEIYGIILFTVGVVLITYSVNKLNK